MESFFVSDPTKEKSSLITNKSAIQRYNQTNGNLSKSPYERGCAFLETNRYLLAVHEFNKMDAEERAKRVYDVACKLFNHEQYEAAFKYYENAMHEGFEIENAFEIACKLLENKQYGKAIEFFNLVPDETIHFHFHTKRGAAYYHADDHQKAMTDFLKSITLKHETDTTYYYMAEIYEKQGHLENAVRCYNTVSERNYNQDVNCLLKRGAFYCRNKHYDEGIHDFYKVIYKIEHADPRIHVATARIMRAEASAEKKLFGFALLDFYRVLELNPDDYLKNYCKNAAFNLLSDIPLDANLDGIDQETIIELIKKLPDEKAYAIFNSCILNEDSALGLFMKNGGYLFSENNMDVRILICKELQKLAKKMGFEYEAPDHIKIMLQTTLSSQVKKSATDLWNNTRNFVQINFWNENQPLNRNIDEESELNQRFEL